MSSLYSFLGTTDEVTTCDCCGKADLKTTVGIRENESGDVLHFGTTCAARAMKLTVKEVTAGTKAADRAIEAAAAIVAEQKRAAESARWVAYLIERTGGMYDFGGRPDVFRMRASLGPSAFAMFPG